MPTAAEKQALVFLTAVALMGGGVRLWQNREIQQLPVSGADRAGVSGEGVDDQLAAVDGARGGRKGKGKRDVKSKANVRLKREKQAKAPPPVVDLDVASADEIERLPQIGAALSERIVANRDSLGGFGSLGEMARVRGVSKSLLTKIAPLVTFSAPPPRRAFDEIAASAVRENKGRIKAVERALSQSLASQRRAFIAAEKAALVAARNAARLADKKKEQARDKHPLVNWH